MKMRKPCKGRLSNVVLKNAKYWNGKSFELRDEVRLNACEGSETTEFDCNGALVMPALFGLGLDFMEPLRDDVYTFADGFEAMRKGGFYGGLYESAANPIDDADKFTAMVNRFKTEELGGKGFEIKFLGAYSKGFGTDSLAEMVELAEAGVAGFGDGSSAIPHSRFLRLAMEYGKMTGKRFFFQPMDKTLRHSGCVHEGAYSDMLGMKGIPRIAETIAAYTILETARFLQVPVHFKQVTCGETLDSAYHILPPIRSAADREALWQGVIDGTIDAISVNHTPVLRQDTVVNFEDSVPGALSLEVALPAIWNKLVERVGEQRAVELLSSVPARLAGAAPAKDNVVVLSPDRPHMVVESDFAGHVCNSPFTGKELPSSILATYINNVWTEL